HVRRPVIDAHFDWQIQAGPLWKLRHVDVEAAFHEASRGAVCLEVGPAFIDRGCREVVLPGPRVVAVMLNLPLELAKGARESQAWWWLVSGQAISVVSSCAHQSAPFGGRFRLAHCFDLVMSIPKHVCMKRAAARFASGC